MNLNIDLNCRLVWLKTVNFWELSIFGRLEVHLIETILQWQIRPPIFFLEYFLCLWAMNHGGPVWQMTVNFSTTSTFSGMIAHFVTKTLGQRVLGLEFRGQDLLHWLESPSTVVIDHFVYLKTYHWVIFIRKWVSSITIQSKMTNITFLKNDYFDQWAWIDFVTNGVRKL